MGLPHRQEGKCDISGLTARVVANLRRHGTKRQTEPLNGVSTYPIAPGQGVVFGLIFPEPGKYPFVDHSIRSMGLGASGLIDVTP